MESGRVGGVRATLATVVFDPQPAGISRYELTPAQVLEVYVGSSEIGKVAPEQLLEHYRP